MAHLMRTKSETGECLEAFIESGQNLLGSDANVCYLQSDLGTEFTDGYTVEVLNKIGTEFRFSSPDTSEHNGMAERFNQIIQKKVRSYMFDSKLPENMWDLALGAVTYAYNRILRKSIDMEIPIPKFEPKKSFDINQLRRCGYLAYMKVQRNVGSKFGSTGKRAILIEYTSSRFILLRPEEGKFYERKVVCRIRTRDERKTF